MARPVLPKWAVDDVQDETSGQYNVVEPPPEKQLEGWFLGEKPNRQWWNWLHRQAYLCLQQLYGENASVTTAATGVGLFTIDNAIITIDAIDIADTTKYLRAVGYKSPGVAPVFAAGSVQANGLALGAGTISGNQPITGGANVIVKGSSSVIPT